MIKNRKFRLYNGRCADESFVKLIRDNVCEVIPAMQPNIAYALKDICGKTFWGSLSHGKRRIAGQYMVHLVKTGELPLSIAESLHEYPLYYQLK